MEEIKTVLQFISDYGITLLIAGIFLYVVIRVINIFLKKLETAIHSDQAKQAHDVLLEKRTDAGSKVQVLINEKVAQTGSNRIQVIEFSNSVMSVAYLPFRYMTCTYEAYKFGKQATGHKIDRISTSLFVQFFEKLQGCHNMTFDIRDRSCLVGGAMCDLMRDQDEFKALCAPMKSIKGKFIGFVCMTKDDEFTETDVDAIETIADQVSVLLGVADQ